MIRRHIEDSVRRAMADTPVVLLNGARQTGKTTLAQAMATGSASKGRKGHILKIKNCAGQGSALNWLFVRFTAP